MRALNGAAVDNDRDNGGNDFRDPERMPDACGADQAAKQPGNGHHSDNVAHKGNHQRFRALAKPLQRTGTGYGERRYNKTGTNDAQCDSAGGNGLGVGAEYIH